MISHQHPNFVAFLRHLGEADQIKQCLDNPAMFESQFCAYLNSLGQTEGLYAVASAFGDRGKVLVNIPSRAVDLRLVLPSQEIEILYESKPPTLTVVLPEVMCATNLGIDQAPAEPFLGLSSDSTKSSSHFISGHVRFAKQIVIDLKEKSSA